jgi:hypothetical protein
LKRTAVGNTVRRASSGTTTPSLSNAQIRGKPSQKWTSLTLGDSVLNSKADQIEDLSSTQSPGETFVFDPLLEELAQLNPRFEI